MSAATAAIRAANVPSSSNGCVAHCFTSQSHVRRSSGLSPCTRKTTSPGSLIGGTSSQCLPFQRCQSDRLSIDGLCARGPALYAEPTKAAQEAGA